MPTKQYNQISWERLNFEMLPRGERGLRNTNGAEKSKELSLGNKSLNFQREVIKPN